MKRGNVFFTNKKIANFSWLMILICIGLILLCTITLFSEHIKNKFHTFSSPLQKILWDTGEKASAFFESILNGGSIAKENDFLRSENQKLLFQIAALKSIQEGNEAQSSIFSLCQNTGFNLKMAGITGLETNDILTIDKGTDDGISEGMPVISQENALVGVIKKSHKGFSEILLISSKNSSINVKTMENADNSDAESDGILKGLNNLKAALEMVSVSSKLADDQILVTSSIDKTYPKNLLIGKISNIQKDDQKPFQKADVKLFFDARKFENVFVITNYKRQ